jgi:hypothetical protein
VLPSNGDALCFYLLAMMKSAREQKRRLRLRLFRVTTCCWKQVKERVAIVCEAGAKMPADLGGII